MVINSQCAFRDCNAIVRIFIFTLRCTNLIGSCTLTGCSVIGNTFDDISLYQSSLCNAIAKDRIIRSDMLRHFLHLQIQRSRCNRYTAVCRYHYFIIICIGISSCCHLCLCAVNCYLLTCSGIYICLAVCIGSCSGHSRNNKCLSFDSGIHGCCYFHIRRAVIVLLFCCYHCRYGLRRNSEFLCYKSFFIVIICRIGNSYHIVSGILWNIFCVRKIRLALLLVLYLWCTVIL